MDVIRKLRGKEEAPIEALPQLDVVIDDWLNTGEVMNGGGWRRDQDGASWWLPAKELAYYEMINNDPDWADDDVFSGWFDTFRKERRLRTNRTYGFSYYGEGVKKSYDSGGYFKSMWKGFGYGSSGYGSEETTELATVLSFVRTLIQAVRTRPGRYEVTFAKEDSRDAPTSYSDFANQAIVVSPQAALDKKIAEDRRIRVTTGWALHEAAHTEHTVDRWPVLLKPFTLKPPQVASLLLNIIEDVRIEFLMGKDFPGFADYFEDSRQYLWEIGKSARKAGDRDEGEMPSNLGEMLRFIVRTIRWPDKLEPVLVSNETKEEFAWWRAWHDEYKPITTNPKIRVHLEKALNRLSAMFRTDMEKEVADFEKMEKDSSDREKVLREIIGKLEKALREHAMIKEACASKASDDKLSTSSEEEVRRKIDEEWSVEKTDPTDSGVSGFGIVIRKERINDAKLAAYVPDRGPMARRLKSAFVLRPSRPEYADRLLRNGQVDDDELWRWGVNDFRVFEQRVRETAPDTDITLLVDQSGSMGESRRIGAARRLAQLMVDCLSSMDGVNLKVRGHTGQCEENPKGMLINRIWEPGDDVGRLSLLTAEAQNMDGHAISWCVKELLAGRGSTQKILIVLADGEPYAHGYNGPSAVHHVREVVTKAERQGVYVVQLGVGGSLSEVEQRRMFNHYIPYSDDENLLRDLTKLMASLL